jgi:thiol-disulfide isomerase/thioredoxin
LDFWSIHCGGCIASFARLDSLQKKFADKMQLLFVNEESKQETSEFFARRRKLCLPHAPFVTTDSLLNGMFPHQGVPYSVWIDTSGRVIYTTQGYNTADWSVSKYLAGDKPGVTAVAPKKYVPSFIGEEWKKSMTYYSYITHVIPGILLEANEDIPGYLQLSDRYTSAVQLLKEAYAEQSKYNFDRPGRLELRIKNLFPYVRPDLSDSNYNFWLQNYCYNYHLFWPEEKKDEFYKVMQSDLEKYFGLHGEVVQKTVNCLTLVRTTKEDKLKTKGGTPFINFYVVSDEMVYPGRVRRVVNQPFEVFAGRLETLAEYIYKKPFVDQTNYKGNIDFEIDGRLWDSITLPQLKQYLRKYGLDLIEKPCLLPVLVISEKKK